MDRQDQVTRAAAPAGAHEGSYVDIPAILAGAIIAAGTATVFTTFGAALGLGALSAEPGEGLGFGAMALFAIFTMLSVIGSYMLGGYITGRMRRRVDRASTEEVTARDGIHGLVVWGIGTILGGMVLASAVTGTAKIAGEVAGTAVQAAGTAVGGLAQGAGQLAGGAVSGVGQAVGGAVSGAGQLLGNAAGGVAQAAGEAMPEGMQSNPLDYLSDGLLRGDPATLNQGAYSDQQIRREIAGIIAGVVRTGEVSDADRQYLVNATAARTGLSEAEVNARVDQAVQQAQDMRNEAARKIEEAKAEAERLKTEAQAEVERLQAEAAQKAEEAKQAAIDAAEQARQAGVLTAFLLAASALVAAVAAYIGAVKGGRHRDEGRLWGGLTYRR